MLLLFSIRCALSRLGAHHYKLHHGKFASAVYYCLLSVSNLSIFFFHIYSAFNFLSYSFKSAMSSKVKIIKRDNGSDTI